MTWSGWLRRRRAAAYGAGPGLDDALDACRRLAAYGMRSTVGYSSPAGERPRAVADVHLAAFDRLAGENLDCMVSVKLSALAFDPALFDELAAGAVASGRILHVDALAADTADATWPLLEKAAPGGHLGATLPGRWARSVDDAARMAGPRRPHPGGEGAVGRRRPRRRPGTRRRLRPGGRTAPRRSRERRGPHARHRPARRLAAPPDRQRDAMLGEVALRLPFGRPLLTARRLGLPGRAYVPFGDRGATYGIRDVTRGPAAARWLLEDLLLGADKTWHGIRRSETRT